MSAGRPGNSTGPLQLNINGYDVVVTRRSPTGSMGDVAIQINLGFLGWSSLVIPLSEWRQIETYVNATP